MHYVIIGNSAAGIFAAESIRAVDEAGSITMISAEAETVPYCRCLTSYFLSGSIKEPQVYIRPTDFYHQMNIEPLLGQQVVNVDPAGQEVHLANGNIVPYDRLLIATGASPVAPPIPGIDAEGVYYLRTMEDARKINDSIPHTKEVVVIGGGLVGLKAAKALRARGLQVTIVEFFAYLMHTSLDVDAGRILEDVLKQHGYNIYVNTAVTEIKTADGPDGKPRVIGIRLSNGKELPCQMVVAGAGVRTNTKLVQGTKIAVNRGIVVDDQMRTNAPNVYAAGDVAESFDPIWGKNRINALWPIAALHGQVAGYNMAGVPKKYPGGIGMNSSHFYELPIISAGLTQVLPGCKAYIRREGNVYRKLITRQGRLVGMITMGDTEGAGVLTGLILKGADVSTIIEELLNNRLSYALALQAGPGSSAFVDQKEVV